MPQTTQAERRTMTVPEAARALGVGARTLYTQIAEGRCPLTVIHIGERRVISRESVERALRDGLPPSKERAS